MHAPKMERRLAPTMRDSHNRTQIIKADNFAMTMWLENLRIKTITYDVYKWTGMPQKLTELLTCCLVVTDDSDTDRGDPNT